jgi:hypothetical protein
MYQHPSEIVNEERVIYFATPPGLVGKPCKIQYQYGDGGSGPVLVTYYRDANGRERLESRWPVSGRTTIVLFDPSAKVHYFCDLDRKTYSSGPQLPENGALDIPVPQSKLATIVHEFLNGNGVIPEPELFHLPDGLKLQSKPANE